MRGQRFQNMPIDGTSRIGFKHAHATRDARTTSPRRTGDIQMSRRILFSAFLATSFTTLAAHAEPTAAETRTAAEAVVAEVHDEAPLEPRRSRVAIIVSTEVASLPGLAITIDGVVVTPATFNRRLPVDGGKHVIVASAPNRKSFERTVTIANQGVALEVWVTLPEDNAAASTTPGHVNVTARQDVPISMDADTSTNDTSGMPALQTAGLVTGGLGIALASVGIGVGASGLVATNDTNAFPAAKKNGNGSLATADANHGSADDQMTAGWLVTGAGGAAVLAGIVMIATAPSSDAPATAWTIAPYGQGGASFQMAF
jgi:hypothetical protein